MATTYGTQNRATQTGQVSGPSSYGPYGPGYNPGSQPYGPNGPTGTMENYRPSEYAQQQQQQPVQPAAPAGPVQNPEDISSADDPYARSYETRFTQRKDLLSEDQVNQFANSLTYEQLVDILGEERATALIQARAGNGSDTVSDPHGGMTNPLAGPVGLSGLTESELALIRNSMTDEQINTMFPDVDFSSVGDIRDYGYYDKNGEWVQVRDLTNIADLLRQMRSLTQTAPGSPELLDVAGSSAMQGLEALAALMSDPNRTQQDLDAAQTYAEQQMGLAPGGLSALINQGITQLGQGVQGQQGVSNQYQDMWNRQTQNQVSQMRAETQQAIEALGASGRTGRAFAELDTLSRQVSDYDTQRFLELSNHDLAVKQVEYEALQKRLDQEWQMGQVSIDQYTTQLKENRSLAMQAYAGQIDAYLKENDQRLSAYSLEMQTLQQQALLIQTTIAADLGVSQAMIDETASMYSQWMSDWYTKMEVVNQQQAQNQQQQQNNMNIFGMIIGGLASFIPVIGPGINKAING